MRNKVRRYSTTNEDCPTCPWHDTTIWPRSDAVNAKPMDTALAALVLSLGGMSGNTGQDKLVDEYRSACVTAYQSRLAGPQPALDDQQFRQAREAARDVVAASCRAFADRLERHAPLSSAQTNLLQAARQLIDDSDDRRCTEAELIGTFSTHAESYYQRGICAEDRHRSAALYREAVKADPQHIGARMMLTGSDALDSQERAKHAEVLYDLDHSLYSRLEAAQVIMDGAIDRNDKVGALGFRERVRRDVGCAAMDEVGIDDFCVQSWVSVATAYSSTGRPLPDDRATRFGESAADRRLLARVADHVRTPAQVEELLADPVIGANLIDAYTDNPDFPGLLEDRAAFVEHLRGDPPQVKAVERDTRLSQWLGRANWKPRMLAQAELLLAVLRDYPEELRSAAHYVGLARGAANWGDQIAAYRKAVALNPRDLETRCDLAWALGRTGQRAEARNMYEALAGESDPPCDAKERLVRLAELAEGTEQVFPTPSLDDDPGHFRLLLDW